MSKKIKQKYNKVSLAESVKYYLDNTGVLLTNEQPMSETGFQKPYTMTDHLAERVADHVVKDMQKALLSGHAIYFPEIGFIEVTTLKAGRRFMNIATKTPSTTLKDKSKIKARASLEMKALLNGSDDEAVTPAQE